MKFEASFGRRRGVDVTVNSTLLQTARGLFFRQKRVEKHMLLLSIAGSRQTSCLVSFLLTLNLTDRLVFVSHTIDEALL